MTTHSIKHILVKNSGFGNLDISEVDLAKLVNGLTDSDPITVSGTVGLEIDFFSRYKISEIRYYYNEDSVVSIQHSQDGQSWSDFSPLVCDGYASVSGELENFELWPSKLRVLHAPVGATALAYEIVITNDDTEVVFVPTGYDVDSSVDAEITEIPVYNASQEVRDIRCFIEVDETDAYDEGILISDSFSGPFISKFSRGFKYPDTFPWSSGVFSGVIISGTSLVLDPTSGTGYYTSPIVDISLLEPSRVFWEYTQTANSYIDYSSSIDSSSTIGIRLFDNAPAGLWVSGCAPDADDPFWGVLSGTLQYSPIVNYSILVGPPGRGRYCQFQVEFITSVSGESASVNTLGLEEATTISGVGASSYGTLYVSTNFGSYVAGQTTGILSFFQE